MTCGWTVVFPGYFGFIQHLQLHFLLLAYKCLHGTAPSYLREMRKKYAPTRTLGSTSKNLLCEPRTNMNTYGDRSFSACAPKLHVWNQLTNNIRAARSVASFKLQLTTHLFKDVFIKYLCGYQDISFDNECNAPLSMFIWKGRNII